jgi:hypothetical protein
MQLREEALRKRREVAKLRNSVDLKRSHSQSGSFDNVKKTGISVHLVGRSASVARTDTNTLSPTSHSMTPTGSLRRVTATINGDPVHRRSLVHDDYDSDDTWSDGTDEDRADQERRRLVLAGLALDDPQEIED